MTTTAQQSPADLNPAIYGYALEPGKDALMSGFPHERVWFGDPAAAKAAADKAAAESGPAPGKAPLSEGETKEALVRVRRGLHQTILASAPEHGWTEKEAHEIASRAELIFLRALEKGAAVEGAIHLGIALAQRANAAWTIMNADDPEAAFEQVIAQKTNSDDPLDQKKANAARQAFTAARGRGAPLEACFYQALDASAALAES